MFLLDEKFDLTLGITKSKRNPWFNMVKVSGDNHVEKILNDKSFLRSPLVIAFATIISV